MNKKDILKLFVIIIIAIISGAICGKLVFDNLI